MSEITGAATCVAMVEVCVAEVGWSRFREILCRPKAKSKPTGSTNAGQFAVAAQVPQSICMLQHQHSSIDVLLQHLQCTHHRKYAHLDAARLEPERVPVNRERHSACVGTPTPNNYDRMRLVLRKYRHGVIVSGGAPTRRRRTRARRVVAVISSQARHPCVLVLLEAPVALATGRVRDLDGEPSALRRPETAASCDGFLWCELWVRIVGSTAAHRACKARRAQTSVRRRQVSPRYTLLGPLHPTVPVQHNERKKETSELKVHVVGSTVSH